MLNDNNYDAIPENYRPETEVIDKYLLVGCYDIDQRDLQLDHGLDQYLTQTPVQ